MVLANDKPDPDPPDPGVAAALAAAMPRVLGASAWLRRTLTALGLETAAPGAVSLAVRSWLAAQAQSAWDEERLAAGYAQEGGRAAAGSALRRLRRRLLAGLMLRDAAGVAPVEEVTAAMTAYADLAVRELLAVHAAELARQHGVPRTGEGVAGDLMVLAMGKAGTGELNVSSDLDLVFAYPDRLQCGGGEGRPLEGQEFFDRLGRRLIAALGEPTAEGFVFRVDMRLRPHGDAGPLAVSVAMLEDYFVREGREWERFAWAKARIIDSPVLCAPAEFAAQAAALQAVVAPFVYRKYFDFGAIGAIRDLHQRIGAESRRRAAGRPERERNVKLGRGGIREIEFLAQNFAIMRGGRERRLRGHGTVATLQVAARLGLLEAREAARLEDDYRFLRRLEHALQYRDDAQTHLLPSGEAELEEVAQLLGMASGAAVAARYGATCEEVARSFDRMFPAESSWVADAGAPVFDEEFFTRHGFADPALAAQRLREALGAPRLATLSPAARVTLERLAAQAVEGMGALARDDTLGVEVAPDELLLRWIRLVEVIGRRSTYYALLAEYPRAHQRVLRLMATGGWATEYLLRHPILLDELIDERERDLGDAPLRDDLAPVPGAAEPYWEPWIATVREDILHAGDDVERQMNVLRDAHHAQLFRLLLADLAGRLALEHLADHLSALADGVIRLALEAAWRNLAAAAGTPQAAMPRLAVIAYGKLGGRELGYASDLDLAFVYGESGAGADADAVQSTALVRRLIAWLTTATSSGNLFDIDLRLRPNGNAGLLVTSMEAFDRYQTNADGHGAWVWEHQALTRARGCAGDAALRAAVEDLRARVLRQSRPRPALVEEVIAMRQRMLEGHVNRSDRFDLKHDRGGMVDIEFTVQFLVLAHAHDHAQLLANRGNIGLLQIAAQLDLVPATLAQECAAAYRRYRALQHSLRLNGSAHARVPHALVAEERAAVERLWRIVFGTEQPTA